MTIRPDLLDVLARRALTEAVTLFRGITSADTEPWVPEVWLLTEW